MLLNTEGNSMMFPQRDEDSRLEISFYMCARAQRTFHVEWQNIITLLDKTTYTFICIMPSCAL